MFDLEKREKIIVAFLLAVLLIGIALAAYKNSVPPANIEIRDFPVEKIKVNINEAEAVDFMKLDGVGRSLAERIMDYRAKEGHFSSIEDIKKVKGIGDKLFNKIKDDITVE